MNSTICSFVSSQPNNFQRNPKLKISIREHLLHVIIMWFLWKQWSLPGEMTKPPHRRKNISNNVLPTEETGAVWQYETTHRNNDSDVECMRNSTSRWRKNLNWTYIQRENSSLNGPGFQKNKLKYIYIFLLGNLVFESGVEVVYSYWLDITRLHIQRCLHVLIYGH